MHRLLVVSQQYVSHIMVITFIGNPFVIDSSFFLQDTLPEPRTSSFILCALTEHPLLMILIDNIRLIG